LSVRLFSPFSFVLSAVALLAGLHAPVAPAADEPAQRGELDRLVEKVGMPYTERVFGVILANLQTIMPGQLLKGFGQGAKLPATWRPGNPQWERAHQRLATAIAEEEKRGGPIFVYTRADFVASFTSPWSREEVQFLTEVAGSDYGRSYIRVLDLTMVTIFVKVLNSLPEVTDAARTQGAAIEAEARNEFGKAMVDLMSYEKQSGETASRLKDLVGRVNRADGEKLGSAMIKTPTARVMNAMYDCLGDLVQFVEEFRKLPQASGPL
jgi:hypothetical protein